MPGDRSKYTKKRKQTAEGIERRLEERGLEAQVAKGKANAALSKPKGDRKGGSGRGRQAHSGTAKKKERIEAGELRADNPIAARRVSAHRASEPQAEKPTSKRRSGRITEGR